MASSRSKKRSKDSTNDDLKIRGFVHMVMRDAKTGRIVGERNVENALMNAGRDKIANLIASQPADPNKISHAQVGVGTTATNATHTDLATAIGLARKTLTSAANFSTLSTGVARFMFSYDTGEANSTLVEIGLFNSSSGGTMFSRALFNSTTKDTGMTVAFTYDLVFSV